MTEPPQAGDDTRIPVTILTGFLGSGKTTILNHLVRQPEMSDALVIINEFGQIGLDHLLVAQSEDSATVRLDNGCICCTIRSDLLKTLKDLPWRFSRNGKRQFNRVVIETTGLADPAPIIGTLLKESALQGKYRLLSVVATVDASLGLTTLGRHPQAPKQVVLADCVIVTKTDQLAGRQAPQALLERLDTLNPQAHRAFTCHGRAEPAWFTTARQRRQRFSLPDAQHGHGQEIAALGLIATPGLSLSFWQHWQMSLIERLGEDLFRLKGLVYTDGERRARVLQSVQHIVMPPFSPETEPPDGTGQIILIGRDLSWQRLADLSIDVSAVRPLESVQQNQRPDRNRQSDRHHHG